MQSRLSLSTTKILCFVILLTNITQMPQLLERGYNSTITLVCWGVLGGYLLVTGQSSINKVNLRAISYLVLLLTFSNVVGAITGIDYMNTAIVYPFALSVFVFIMGSLSYRYINCDNIRLIYFSYIISGTIVAISVYYDSFASGFSWTSRGYAYASKNSVAQIILTVVILLIFVKMNTFFQKTLKLGVLVFLVLLLFMLKSRASLLGLGVIVWAILFDSSIKRRYKLLTIIALITAIYAVGANDNLYDIVVNGIILAGRQSGNLNDISSGRYDMIGEFVEIFKDNPMLGVGVHYLESFPLSVLCQYGIVGAIPIILFLVFPFPLIKKMTHTSNRQIIIVILICYYINGFFEELAPLGPGVKCYFLWFLLGLESHNGRVLEKYRK